MVTLHATPTGAEVQRDGPPGESKRTSIRVIFVLPIAAFLVLAALLALGLNRDPREIPSALLGKPVPAFDLPPVQGGVPGLSSADLRGEASLVNVFASWCTACRQEHPLFMQLKAEGAVPIHGLNYRDKPADAAGWLDTLGDPYTRTGADRDGRVAIDWGVYGVLETFVVSADGRIVHKHIGPLTRRDLDDTILPLIASLRRGRSASADAVDDPPAEAGRKP